jgi:hypothetical protein
LDLVLLLFPQRSHQKCVDADWVTHQ